jgi:hypothetical protein
MQREPSAGLLLVEFDMLKDQGFLSDSDVVPGPDREAAMERARTRRNTAKHLSCQAGRNPGFFLQRCVDEIRDHNSRQLENPCRGRSRSPTRTPAPTPPPGSTTSGPEQILEDVVRGGRLLTQTPRVHRPYRDMPDDICQCSPMAGYHTHGVPSTNSRKRGECTICNKLVNFDPRV